MKSLLISQGMSAGEENELEIVDDGSELFQRHLQGKRNREGEVEDPKSAIESETTGIRKAYKKSFPPLTDATGLEAVLSGLKELGAPFQMTTVMNGMTFFEVMKSALQWYDEEILQKFQRCTSQEYQKPSYTSKIKALFGGDAQKSIFFRALLSAQTKEWKDVTSRAEDIKKTYTQTKGTKENRYGVLTTAAAINIALYRASTNSLISPGQSIFMGDKSFKQWYEEFELFLEKFALYQGEVYRELDAEVKERTIKPDWTSLLMLICTSERRERLDYNARIKNKPEAIREIQLPVFKGKLTHLLAYANLLAQGKMKAQ